MASILFTNQDWTPEKKRQYFDEYIKLKKSCRKWHKAPKKFKQLRLWSYDKACLTGDIWEDIIDEQLYEPIIKSKLTNSIW